MYIDSNYGRNWCSSGTSAGRRPGPMKSSIHAEAGRSNAHWGGSASMMHRSQRQKQPQAHQSMTNMRFNATTKGLTDGSNGYGAVFSYHYPSSTSSACSYTDVCGPGSRIHDEDDLGGRSCNLSDPLADDVQPRRLPTHVVEKIQERFERRVLHLCNRSNTKKSTKIADNSASASSDTNDSIQSDNPQASKYKLIAAFLVNRGVVEAWHIYSLLPVETDRSAPASSSPLSVYTGVRRRFELTQRRRRLLQRYYSGARQYVVLYINNNCSEHYLPVGMANKESQVEGNSQHISERQNSASVFLDQSQRLVRRLFTCMLTRSKSSKHDPHPCVSSSDSSPVQGDRSKQRLRRNFSMPPGVRSSSTPLRGDKDTSSPTKRKQLDPRRSEHNSIMRRLLEHFWLSGTDQRDSPTGYESNKSKGACTSQVKYENKTTVNNCKSLDDDKPDVNDCIEYPTGDNSSIGLIDLGSTTESSTTSDPVIILPPAKASSPEEIVTKGGRLKTGGQEQTLTTSHSPSPSGSSNNSSKLDSQSWDGVWLPKS